MKVMRNVNEEMKKCYYHIMERTARHSGAAHSFISSFTFLITHFSFLILLYGCARMGSPDGGWFDDDPPRIVRCTPADQATNVTANKIVIEFDEYIKLEDPTQSVIVSPPQLEMPEIKEAG